MRIIAALAVCLVVGIVILGGSMYFLLLGKTAQGSALHSQLEQGLEGIVGPQFDVSLDEAELAFDFDGFVGIKSRDIVVVRKSDGGVLSTVGELSVSLKLWQLLIGNLAFDSVYIEEGVINAEFLGTGQGLLVPSHLDKPLNVLGSELSRFKQQMIDGKLDEFELRNSRVTGRIFGRKEQDPLEIETLRFKPKSDGSFILNGQLSTINSAINLFATYASGNDAGHA